MKNFLHSAVRKSVFIPEKFQLWYHLSMPEIFSYKPKMDHLSLPKQMSVKEQVAHDLNSYLNHSADKQKKLNQISKKIGVHLKTLNRISSLENQPNYSTVFKIYRYILNENDDAKLLEQCPQSVQAYLKKANPQKLEKNVAYSPLTEHEVGQNSVALELVVLCSSGTISASEIKDRFGSYGYELTRTLVAKRILAEIKSDLFSIGSSQMNMSPETVIKMGLQITASYAKAQDSDIKGKNFHGFYAEGLSEAAYQEWIRIDEEAFRRKVQLAKNPKYLGTLKAYTFNSVDTLNKKDTL